MNDRVLLDAMLTAPVGIDADSVPEVAALVDRWEKLEPDKLAAHADEIGLTEKQFARLSEVLTAERRGGRYDNLVGLYSPQRIPGFGFGMGDVTLFDFLGTHGLLPEPHTEV